MSRFAVIKGKHHRVFIDDELKSLRQFLRRESYSSIVILTDSNTERLCLPKLIESVRLKNFNSISIQAGEENKTLISAEKLWEQLLLLADRKTLFINLGGGMISDIGGFSASVFKRGIDFIHVPTTLLAMVDASIGGKTAIDFVNHKNQLGTFAQPKAVFISTAWLTTLPKEQLLSAYAEMSKHAMLTGLKEWKQFVLNFNNVESLEEQISNAVKFKLKITDKDLYETGERKQLNFGHTVGHAIESFWLLQGKQIPHGNAVAAGMICELYLSLKIFKPSENIFSEQIDFLKNNFPKVEFKETDIDEVLSFVKTDKKNIKGKIKPIVLKRIGKPYWEYEVSIELIRESLIYYYQL